MATVNRQYKDSVFSLLFNTPDAVRELYETLMNVKLPPDATVTITTLKNVLYKTLRNDLAFEVAGKLVVLVEHQSTINPNMAIRILLYLAGVYEILTAGVSLYGRKKLTLPRPECVVLYNGVEDYPDECIINLSDSFADAASLGLSPDILPALELRVRVININRGRNEELLGRSKLLEGYSAFIGKVRDFEGGDLGGRRRGKLSAEAKEEAMRKAILWCIKNDILKDFLQENGSEVTNMLMAEWKLEEALVVERAEGWEAGWEKGRGEGLEEGRMEGRMEGRGEGRMETARNALSKGLPPDIISEITGLDIQTIQDLNRRL